MHASNSEVHANGSEFPTDKQSVFWSCGAVDYVLSSDDKGELTDDLAKDLLQTKALKRLRNIGFLGAIDYFRKGNGKAAHRRRHNRLEHSVGVALLAQKFSKTAEICEAERLKLVAAALLHDVGHGPLSHTLEPVFEDEHGINHHSSTEDVIRGDKIFEREVLNVLIHHKVDPDEIISLINGEDVGPYSFLFSGKINLDTLEGITRCRAIVGRRAAFGTAMSTVERWAKSGNSSFPKSDFDDFWELKHNVYSLLINSSLGLTMDTVAQAWMRANLANIDPSDFHLDEPQLRKKHPKLFDFICKAAHDQKALREDLPSDWLHADVQARKRRYYVDDSGENITQRYKYQKDSWTVSLSEILA